MPILKIAPSILSADKTKLQEEVDTVATGDLLHIDIMDGRFVPPTTFAVHDIAQLKTNLPLDVHLMVKNPEKEFVDWYADIGASIITVHIEATTKLNEIFKKLKAKNIKRGLAINPETKVSKIKPYLKNIDMLVVMSVNPGYAAQKFISDVLKKVKEIRKLKPSLDIEIDGGINKETAKAAVKAGANVLVAGNHIFSQKDRAEAIVSLRKSNL